MWVFLNMNQIHYIQLSTFIEVENPQDLKTCFSKDTNEGFDRLIHQYIASHPWGLTKCSWFVISNCFYYISYFFQLLMDLVRKRTFKSSFLTLLANICVFLKGELDCVTDGLTMSCLTYLMPRWILLEKVPLKFPSKDLMTSLMGVF